jgi:carbamoyl-phosphate synthase large subunit
MNILLTGIGCPGTAGTVHSIREHLGRRTQTFDYKIIGIDSNPNITSEICSPHTCDKFYSVPNAKQEQSYIEYIQHICDNERIDLIIPQTTIENEIFSKYKNCKITDTLFFVNFTDLLVQEYSTFSILNNKATLYDHISKKLNDDYIPKTCITDRPTGLFDCIEKNFCDKERFVIKPILSNGSRGMRIIDRNIDTASRFFSDKLDSVISMSMLKTFFKNDTIFKIPLLVMEYLPGDEYSVDCFRKDSTFKRIVIRERVEIKNGITWISEVVYEPKLERICDELLEEYDIKGVIGFQFKKDDEENFKILECNPRIQGSMIASTLAGCNIIGLGIDHTLGNNISENYHTPEIGHKMFRTWGWI